MFSHSVSNVGSSAPTSITPSECGDHADTNFQEDPRRRSSHLRHLAAAAGASEARARASRVQQFSVPYSLSGNSSTALSLQSQHSVPLELSSSPPPHTPGLRRTQSFRQLPQSLPQGHSLFAMNENAVDVGDFNEDFVIDEVSPSEDERFAESVIRGHGEFKLCSTMQTYLSFNEVSWTSIQVLLVLHHILPPCLPPHNVSLCFVLHQVFILLRRYRGCRSSTPSAEPCPSPARQCTAPCST